MLQATYNKIMDLSGHRHATWMLGFISFIESSFFPLPPDPLLLTMGLRHRDRVWYYGALCTITSVFGGYLGYYIGYSVFETWGHVIIDAYGLQAAFDKFQQDFQKWGFWLICAKGITPIPYKVVTLASGVAKLDLMTFTLSSLVARGFRFLYVSFFIWKFGPAVKEKLEKNLTLITVVGLSVLVLGFILVKWIWG